MAGWAWAACVWRWRWHVGVAGLCARLTGAMTKLGAACFLGGCHQGRGWIIAMRSAEGDVTGAVGGPPSRGGACPSGRLKGDIHATLSELSIL